jgi:uncharacterized protein (DUF58 family)
MGPVTPLAMSMLTAIAWAVSLAVLSARPELFLAALPLALALATVAARRSRPDHAVALRVSADRVFEGDAVTVTVEVTAESRLPLVEVLGPLPRDATLARGRQRAVLTLGPGETGTVEYDLRCAVRGVYDLGLVVVRVRDRWGLRAWERRHVERAVVRVYPRIAPLRSLPHPLHTRTSAGDYVSGALGEGIEPGDIRQFAPGDRIRQVNWRASLRLGSLYVTQHHRERNAHVVLMLDTLAEVGAPAGTTLDFSVRAAASLATAYLARKDSVGLVTYGGTTDWIRPGSGRIQYERLADALLRASVSFTYVAKDLALVPPRVLPPHALVIALTPLLDRRFARAALDLAARGFDLVVLVVSPVGATRVALRRSTANDLACRLWVLVRRPLLDEFRRQGVPVVEWDPTTPLEPALAGLARRRPQLASAG